MLYAKPCCAVDPIENEEDRKKVSTAVWAAAQQFRNIISYSVDCSTDSLSEILCSNKVESEL